MKTSKTQSHGKHGPTRLYRMGQILLAIFALLGVVIGGAIGHYLFGRLGVGFIIGSAVGIMLGVSARALVRR